MPDTPTLILTKSFLSPISAYIPVSSLVVEATDITVVEFFFITSTFSLIVWLPKAVLKVLSNPIDAVVILIFGTLLFPNKTFKNDLRFLDIFSTVSSIIPSLVIIAFFTALLIVISP